MLIGGPTLVAGVEERMSKKITALSPRSTKIKVVAPPERKCNTWIGGSTLVNSLNTYNRVSFFFLLYLAYQLHLIPKQVVNVSLIISRRLRGSSLTSTFCADVYNKGSIL